MEDSKIIELVEQTNLSDWEEFSKTGNSPSDILHEIDLNIKDNIPNFNQLSNNRATLYNTRQLAYKTIGNSIYGYTGTVNSRFYTLDIAESVTTQGVEMIQKSQNLIEAELGLKILYGDTDSMFILLDDKIPDDIKKSNDRAIIDWIRNVYVKSEIYPKLKPLLDKLASDIGCGDKHYFKFKQEIIAKRALFLKSKNNKKEFAKKRYILWIVDEDGVPRDELFLRGVEIRRSELSTYIRDFLTEWVTDIIKGEQPIDDIVEKLYIFKAKLINAIDNKEIEKFSKNISLTKDSSEYKSFAYTVKGAMLWNTILYNIVGAGKIVVGSKMRVIFLKEKTYYKDLYTNSEREEIKSTLAKTNVALIKTKASELFKLCNNKLTKEECLIISGMQYFELHSISLPSDVKKIPDSVLSVYHIDTSEIIDKLFYEQVETYLSMIGRDIKNVKYGLDDMDDII